MTVQFKTYLRRFRDDTNGTAAVEAVVIMPVLFWAFMAIAVFFDMYQSRSSTEKAAFTVSDMLSRETAAVNGDYIDNALDLFETMSTLDADQTMRVSVVSWSDVEEDYVLDWSYGTGLVEALTASDLNNLEDKLPTLVNGERLILVQTYGAYAPSVNVGFGTIDMNTLVFSRPRFAPQLAWSDT
ncbi:TadE/TadG family type IV pilus assembly protein [Shimia abyssi]|uniref:TadE-like protein n=1 Tax=Shimia abyssi TaxID=1662395 RepID=A0A2P8FE94_9RHOB|nr:TadE/TadG family type IV pilus assembly protein [Shimia abyssi]PSL20033.1 TadE-like protein [Shimia abyssi]